MGPSLPDAKRFANDNIKLMPPARQGDVIQVLRAGATAIGLIDGQFEFVAPVWHKELLYALSCGVPVFGAASMGALRAAECQPFGMIGIGMIFEQYRSGARVDEGDVVLLHGPAELNYPSLTIPLVNLDATLNKAKSLKLLTDPAIEAIAAAARTIYFKERSWKRIAEKADFDPAVLREVVRQAWTDQKQLDAIALLERIATGALPAIAPDWPFNATPVWRQLYPKLHLPRA